MKPCNNKGCESYEKYKDTTCIHALACKIYQPNNTTGIITDKQADLLINSMYCYILTKAVEVPFAVGVKRAWKEAGLIIQEKTTSLDNAMASMQIVENAPSEEIAIKYLHEVVEYSNQAIKELEGK